MGGSCILLGRRISAFAAVLSAVLLLAGKPAAGFSPRATLGSCGNGVIDNGEECDDGGICIGGPNAGTVCQGDGQCLGNGVCVAGSKEDTSCADDTNCPGGLCVHCRAFGADGCAANCTTETDVPVSLVPGQLQGGQMVPGTSGAMVRGQIINLPVPLQGSLVVTAGKARDGMVPIAVRSDSAEYARVPVSNLACGCLRGLAGKTCGGTLFEPDGITPSVSCTPEYTAGDSACAGNNPCAPVHGSGNSASGTIGCDGLEGVDVDYQQDCNASAGGLPGTALLGISGAGGPGSARLLNTATIGVVIGPCIGTAPEYGPDGEFCTADDPISAQGTPETLPLTTGAARAVVFNANNSQGFSLGPFGVSGVPFNCDELANGSASGSVVGAFPSCDQPTAGDVVLISSFSMMDFVSPTPTVPPPTPTPYVPLIRGDRGNPAKLKQSCQVEWRVVNPNNPLDGYGLPSNQQVCKDNDTTCDFTPLESGRCEFRVQVCLNNNDPSLPSCLPQGIAQVSITSPRPKRARNLTMRAVLEADVAALNNALTHLFDPTNPELGFVNAPPLTSGQRDLCSEPFGVDVLLGALRKGSVTLTVRSKNQRPLQPARHSSSLKLLCKGRPLT
jgi:hypothetical protein